MDSDKSVKGREELVFSDKFACPICGYSLSELEPAGGRARAGQQDAHRSGPPAFVECHHPQREATPSDVEEPDLGDAPGESPAELVSGLPEMTAEERMRAELEILGLDASRHVLDFYRNYHSIRYVGARLVIRLRATPTKTEMADLNDAFSDILTRGRIETTPPQPPEVSGNDHLHLPRIALHFDRSSHGRLRALIDALNALASAPPVAAPDRDSITAAGSPSRVPRTSTCCAEWRR